MDTVDAAALLKMVDRIKRSTVEFRSGDPPRPSVDLTNAEKQLLVDALLHQAASQGSAGTAAIEECAKVIDGWLESYNDLEIVHRTSDNAHAADCMVQVAKEIRALSPPVKTGGEAEASNGGTTYSPIGRNADGIEVYKRDARPVDAGALEEIGPTGIEAAEIVADYIRLRAPEVDADDAANIIHILHEHGVRFALPKLTAVGESAAVAQAVTDRGDLTKIAAECHRAKWQFDFKDEIKIGMPVARRALVTAFNELHRIGDMALKLRDASPVPSAHREAGFFANLTPEQQKAALEYDGPENHGDPAFARPSANCGGGK